MSAWAREVKSKHRTLALDPLHGKGHEGVKDPDTDSFIYFCPLQDEVCTPSACISCKAY